MHRVLIYLFDQSNLYAASLWLLPHPWFRVAWKNTSSLPLVRSCIVFAPFWRAIAKHTAVRTAWYHNLRLYLTSYLPIHQPTHLTIPITGFGEEGGGLGGGIG